MQQLGLPRKTIQAMVRAMAGAISHELKLGGRMEWPRIGTFYVGKFRARRMHNLHGTGTITARARNLPKMTRYQLPTQTLTPTWRSDKSFDMDVIYPDSRLAVRMLLAQVATLDQCNHLVYLLAQLIIDQMVLGNRITIRNIGRFESSTWIARNGRNPRTGAVLVIPERQQIKFRPARALKEAIN
jgi:nucleoid DNA-binding protein